ncbi:DNA polymerase III subunit delta' [Selenomonas sp. F0473]|uniref:DNA polymerase III subunit delta' n=1 Tax=Selenomonas sp. F0473 TaxID=999423 RepID=UPI0025E102DF|nr:DNA polymerase III subunit delta' [Selenomonas sp. F0473]
MAAKMRETQIPTAEGTAVREVFPQGWEDVRGHAEIVRRLRRLASAGRLPHALIFSGAAGVGKRRTARVLARTLLCASGGDAPCGRCEACRTTAAGVHPDYFEIAPEARGKGAAMIRTEAVREMLIAASEAPAAAKRRIILVDGAERMNETAANRLLKTLEEPAGEILFILVTNAYDAVLPTIRSRAARIAFGALTRTEIEGALLERGGVPDAKAIASLADGSLSRAYDLVDTGLAPRDEALSLLTALPVLRIDEIWRRAEEFGALSHDDRMARLGFFRMGLRDMLVLMEAGTAEIFHADRRAELAALLPQTTRPRIFALLRESDALIRRLGTNVNPALQAEAFLIRARKQFQ